MSASSSSAPSGGKQSCGKLRAKIRQDFLNELSEFIRTKRGSDNGKAYKKDLPAKMRKQFDQARQEGWLQYRLEVKDGTGRWVTPGLPKLSDEEALQQYKDSLKRKRDIMMSFKREADKRAKIKRDELAEIMSQAEKVKTELALLKEEEAGYKIRQEIMAAGDHMIVTAEAAMGVQDELDKLQADNAKALAEIEDLRAKVAAQELLTLK